MKSELRSVLKAALPRALYPSALLRRAVQRQTNLTVHAGPFRGMKYVDRSIWGAYIPKLLGTYELELHDVIERAIRAAPRHVIDIGCAEGYYAVGFLLRLPEARMTVFEQLADGRETVRRLANRNGVAARLEVKESCDPAALSECLQRGAHALIICDVEGYEVELLDPKLVTELVGADILVEVHDANVPNCRATIAQRFEETHRVTHLGQQARARTQYPFKHPLVRVWPGAVLRYGLNEFRSPMTSWLWLEAKRREGDRAPPSAQSA
jgi:hypothetical protein